MVEAVLFSEHFISLLTINNVNIIFSFVQRYLKNPDDDGHVELFDLISEMLAYDPKDRITLRQALRHPFLVPFYKSRRDRSNLLKNDERDRSYSASR